MNTLLNTAIGQKMKAISPRPVRDEKNMDANLYNSEKLLGFDSRDVVLSGSKDALTPSAEDLAIFHKRNHRQGEKYPFLAKIFDDPRAFFREVEGRFEAQKAKTPDDPYSFEFGDYGIPVLKDLEKSLDKELRELSEKREKTGIQKTGEESGLQATGLGSLFTNPFKKRKAKQLDAGVSFVKDLKNDISEKIESGSVSYKALTEIGYFSARALGHFDQEDLGLFERTFLKVDRKLLGYERKTAQEEYQRYKDGDFKLFRRDGHLHKHQLLGPIYEKALFNPEKLEVVSFPVAHSVGPGAFMQLIPHDIFLTGVSADPQAADGFNRPADDFYLHDARHSSWVFGQRRAYEATHQLAPEQIEALEVKQSVWRQQMIDAKKEIKDKNLSKAIGYVTFFLHHDRGFPQVPSSYLPKEDKSPNIQYTSLRLSGQSLGIEKPTQNINKAYDWLREFWMERLPEEYAILEASQPERAPKTLIAS